MTHAHTLLDLLMKRSAYTTHRAWRPAQTTVVVACILLTASAAAQQPDSLRYELTPQFEKGRLNVSITWRTGRREHSALRIAERLGRIENVPALLRRLRIDGGTVKRDGAVWSISHRPNAVITCSYEVDPHRRAFDTLGESHYPITTADFFHGLGNAFLLSPAATTGSPDEFEVVLRWKLPAGYKAVCSWGAGRTVGARLRATDLRHSVYLAGRIKTARREHADRRITVAIVDRFGFTLDEFADTTAAIIRHQCDFMGESDFPEFVVTAIPVGTPLAPGESRLAGSGLYNSFAMFVAPESKLDDAVEHLFAHELFHFWNGRLLKARQPERLVYWFVEGFTDYYSLRILYESGHWDADTFLKWLNKHVRDYYLNPAINASNEDIDRDYWNKRDTVGEAPYQRGLMLGLRWCKLARDKQSPGGLDRLLKSMVGRGRAGGFQASNDSIRAAGVKLLGRWFAADFDRHVANARKIDLPSDVLAPEFVGRPTDIYEYDLGFDKQRSLKERRIRGLRPDSAAAGAGLREGDRLVGWNIYSDPDKPTKLKIERGGKSKLITYKPRGRRVTVLQFHRAKSKQTP